MVRIFCGNQTTLPENYDRFGDTVECLRTGVGVGLHLKNRRPPQTSTNPSAYCGRKSLPAGYDRYATPYQCLRKGVGVGLWKQQEMS